ncbi:DUF1302 family protein [Treponema sp.]|uniref:DUF1302 family protein n=1 Tax=Treponema sp. TaxID=166 RepID=UPI00298DA66B|nr:DUF1302 family protein [Treponema sp.]MCR5612342.1 hypothetical protein [Treponema sp.]
MKKQYLNFAFAFIVLVASAVPLSAEGGVDFSCDIETRWGAALPWTDTDSASGRFTIGDTSFKTKLDAYYGNTSAYAEATLSYDAARALNGAINGSALSGGGVTGSGAGVNFGYGFNLNLGELWADYTSSFWGIRIGRQKTAWGKADGIDVTNIICPENMQSLAQMAIDKAKIAVDAVRVSFNVNSFAADIWWIPFVTSTALPIDDGNPLKRFVIPSSVDFPVPSAGTTLKLPVSIGNITAPEVAIWNGEYGAKLSGYFSALDISLYGFYGWDNIPLFDYTLSYGAPSTPTVPTGLSVSGEYKRVAMIGADAAIPVGETVIRLEAAFFPDRYFQKSSESVLKEKIAAQTAAAMNGTSPAKVDFFEQRNELSALTGVDWMPTGWTITAQYYCDYVFGNIDSLDRETPYTHGVTLSVSKTLLNETLKLNLVALLGLNDFDSVIYPSVNYSISDQLTFSAGAYIFIPGPEKKGKYGTYKDLSTAFISARFAL